MHAYVIAVAILFAPPDSPAVPAHDPYLEALSPYIRELVIDWGLVKPTDYITVSNYSIQYWRELRFSLYDAPPVEDVERFPNTEETAARLKYITTYRNRIDEYRTYPDPTGQQAKGVYQLCERIRKAYDLLDDTHNVFITPPYKRLKLKELRSHIGEEAYYSGQMPPVIPYSELKPF